MLKRFQASASLRKWLVMAVVVIVIGSLTYGAFAMWRSHSKQKLLASITDDPRKIRQAVDEGKISRGEAREAFGQAMEARMNKQMDEYFALPTDKERQKYLDTMIDEVETNRRQWQQRATTRPTTRPNRERGDQPTTRPDNDRRREWAARGDRTPPERRAKMAEFRAAMMQRMRERGMSQGRGGFGRRGGGDAGRGPGGGR